MNNDKINILLLVDTLKGGGVEEWVQEIIRLIDHQRFNVIVAYLIDMRYEDGFSIADLIRQNGGPVEYLGFSKKEIPVNRMKSRLHSKSRFRSFLQYLYLPLSLAHLPKLYRLVKDKNIQVIHCLMHYSLVISALLNLFTKVPVIYQVTESRAQLSEGRPAWIFQTLRVLHPFVRIFFTALSQEELITYGGVPREKIRPIKGAIDTAAVKSVPAGSNPVIPEFSLKGVYPVLLSVGRFTPEKGHIHAIRVLETVLEIFPQAKLIILGDGWEYETIKDLAARLNLTENVILPGFRTDLNNFYSVADIYLRTNLVEAGTLSSYRAMAFEIAVVGFRTEAQECIVNGTNGFLVPCADTKQMAARVIELAESPSLRRNLGKEAGKYVKDFWDIRNAIKDFEKAYTGELRRC
jgi:glycosyltransferase involved in cell wall biosynthesis